MGCFLYQEFMENIIDRFIFCMWKRIFCKKYKSVVVKQDIYRVGKQEVLLCDVWYIYSKKL